MNRLETDNKFGPYLEDFIHVLDSNNLSPDICSSTDHHGELLMAEANIRAGSSPPEFAITNGSYHNFNPMTPSHDLAAYEVPLEGQTPPSSGTLYNLNRTVCSTMEYQGQTNLYQPNTTSGYDINSSWTGAISGIYPEDFCMHGNMRSYTPTEEQTEYQDHYQYLSQTSCDSDDSVEVPNTDRTFYSPNFEQSNITIRQNQEYCLASQTNKLPHFSTFVDKKAQSRRGRPVTFNKPGYHFSDSDSPHSDEDDSRSTRCRRGAKNILLWKFLLNELRKPNCPHIKWEDERSGIFKFIDTTECSRLWGQMKKKDDMNFEKLSRGIRHYYKDGLMSRRDGIRLVYQFNWSRVPKQFWPKQQRMY